MRRMFAIVLIWWFPAASAWAGATYVCVEERSAGWETRDNGEVIVGKFKPDDSKAIVKWYSHEWMGDGSQRSLRLPYVVVSEKGETYTYTSTLCSSVYLDRLA